MTVPSAIRLFVLAMLLLAPARPAGFESQPARAPSVATARAKLDAILARPEFARQRGPSVWDQWRARIAEWLRGLLARLLAPLAKHPAAGGAVFWFFIAALTGALAFWLFRVWTAPGPAAGLAAAGGPLPFASWEEWARKARQAAEAGDFREGVRCAYLAAAAYLQKTEVLPPDPSRTPRESLAAVARSEPHAALAQPLGALTAGLERYWYARRTPLPNEFRDYLVHLETLGCKPI